MRFSCNVHFIWSLEGVLRCCWVYRIVAMAALCPECCGDAAALQLPASQTPPHTSLGLFLWLLRTQAGFLSWYKRMIRETCCVKAKALFSQSDTWKNNCTFVCANREQLFVSHGADCSCSLQSWYRRVLRVPCIDLPARVTPLFGLV